MLIVDAHLDLAWNATNGRDVTKPAAEQPPIRQLNRDLIATVGLPDLRRGNVALVCGTIFCQPKGPDYPGYETPDEAAAQAEAQWAWYASQINAGTLQLVRTRDQLATGPGQIRNSNDESNSKLEIRNGNHAPCFGHSNFEFDSSFEFGISRPTSLILLLEGAEAIRNESDLRTWHARGLRIVGIAWKRTRHAGGTGQPGPLTPEGRTLLKQLDALGIIHDTSHLAEESFWQLLDCTTGPVIASHSNCRAIVPGDRHLSDAMIKAIAARDGVIGINAYDRFLLPPDQYGKRRATLADMVRHIDHACQIIGDTTHIGLGTDMDGGLGRDQIPHELTTSADLPKLASALSAANFPDDAIANILGQNWLTFFRRSLPGT